MNELQDKVVVITGASSGLGRAAALRFAALGAHVVLAARREAALAEVAERCRQSGGSAAYVVTDVTREQDIERLTELALSHSGRIDVWVNNAGVTLFGLLEDGTFEDHRRVIETNLYGAILAARAVVPVFRRQQYGTLINVGSVLSKVGQPFVPSYVISKFALRGLSEALRAELADQPDIHICGLYPYALNTPHFQSGANLIGRPARAMPPDQPVERVAEALVRLALRPRRELHVPRIAYLGVLLHQLFPSATERVLLESLRKWHFDEEQERTKSGNLYHPASEPGQTAGRRPPRLSTFQFALWVLREALQLAFSTARRRVAPRALLPSRG